MPYLYHHIRHDKDEIFYVGISKSKLDYKRAYTTHDRNDIWKKIVAKTTYEVKVVIEHENFDYIKSKEIEHIAYYGRKDLNTGSLANMTMGGEGVTGLSSKHSSKTVINTVTKELISSAKDLSVKLDCSYGVIIAKLNHKNYNDTPYMYKDEYDIGIRQNDLYKKTHIDRRVIDLETLTIHKTSKEVSDLTGLDNSTLLNYLNRKSKNKTNFIWYREYEKGMTIDKASPYSGEGSHRALINIFTKEIFTSQKEASQKSDFSRNHIMCMLRGKKVNYSPFMYYDDYINMDFKDIEKLKVERENLIISRNNNKQIKEKISNFNQKELETEIWKDIPDYEGLYQASNLGRIKRLERKINQVNGFSRVNKEKVLELSFKKGVFKVALKNKSGVTIENPVKVLVISAFKGKYDEDVINIDGNLTNNRIENLKYELYVNRNYKNITYSQRLNKWHCRVTIEGVRQEIGFYNTKEEVKDKLDKVIAEYIEFGKLPQPLKIKTSKFRGVGYSKTNKKWYARDINNKHIGYFQTEEEAHQKVLEDDKKHSKINKQF